MSGEENQEGGVAAAHAAGAAVAADTAVAPSSTAATHGAGPPLLGDAGLLLGFAASPPAKRGAVADEAGDDDEDEEGADPTEGATNNTGREEEAVKAAEDGAGAPVKSEEPDDDDNHHHVGEGDDDDGDEEGSRFSGGEDAASEEGEEDDDATMTMVAESVALDAREEEGTEGNNNNNNNQREEDLPFALSDTEPKWRGARPKRRLCRAQGCPLYSQGTKKGHFCHSHYARSRGRTTTTPGKGGGGGGAMKHDGRTPPREAKEAEEGARSNSDDDSEEDVTIGALQRSVSPGRRPKRKRRTAVQDDDEDHSNAGEEGEEDEEVEYVSSSPPPKGRATQPRRLQGVRRSTRESTPPARLRDVPLVAYRADRFAERYDEYFAEEEVEEVDEEEEEEGWTCECGNVLGAERKRCGQCYRWRGGRHGRYGGVRSRKREDDKEEAEEIEGEEDDGSAEKLPFQISETVRKNGKGNVLCRAVGCPKQSQGRSHEGYCRLHYNAANPVDIGAQEIVGGWTCGCGNVLAAERKRCGNCMKWRRGMHPSTMRAMAMASPQAGSGGDDGRASKRRRRTPIQRDEEAEAEDGEEVEFVSASSPPPRRSRRESTPPARLRDVPFISSMPDNTFDRRQEEEEAQEVEDEEAEEEEEEEEDVPQSKSPPKNKCRLAGCPKFKQSGCDGYCMAHHKQHRQSGGPSPSRGSPAKKHQQSNGGSPTKRGGKHLCKSPGCEKYQQTRCDGFCIGHFAEQKRQPPRTATKSRKKPQCKSPGCEKGAQTGKEGMCAGHFAEEKGQREGQEGGSPRKRGRPVESKDTSSKRPANKVCKADGCTKYPRGGGYCTTHTRDLKQGAQNGTRASLTSPASATKKRNGSRATGPRVMEGLCKDHFPSPGSPVEKRSMKSKGSPGGKKAGAAGSRSKVNPSAGGKKSPAKPNAVVEDNPSDDDNFSFSELELPTPPSDSNGLRRELVLDGEVKGQSGSGETSWRCGQCGNLNSRTSRCGTCRDLQISASELALLERTRYELLSGRDFWICTRCEIGVPSLTSPCGGCHRTISFVPLEMEEFEVFVQNQRKMNGGKAQEWQQRLEQRTKELQEDWSDEEEDKAQKTGGKNSVRLDYYKNGPHARFFCKYSGCLAASQPNGHGLCGEHASSSSAEPERCSLVSQKDRELVADMKDSLYLIYEQMVPCNFDPAAERRSGHHQDLCIGYPGIACKHCVGKDDSSNSSGPPSRWYPGSESAMYMGSFTGSIKKHLRKCPHCPSEVKQKLKLVEEAKAAAKEKEKSTDAKEKIFKKGKSGSRKKFFHRLWCRVHRLPLNEASSSKEHRRSKEKKAFRGKKQEPVMLMGQKKVPIDV